MISFLHKRQIMVWEKTNLPTSEMNFTELINGRVDTHASGGWEGLH